MIRNVCVVRVNAIQLETLFSGTTLLEVSAGKDFEALKGLN